MRHQQPWLPNENQLLSELWLSLDLEALSLRLHRSEDAISQQARKLGLPKRLRRNGVPEHVVKHIQESAGVLPARKIAQEIGCTIHDVYRIARCNRINLK